MSNTDVMNAVNVVQKAILGNTTTPLNTQPPLLASMSVSATKTTESQALTTDKRGDILPTGKMGNTKQTIATTGSISFKTDKPQSSIQTTAIAGRVTFTTNRKESNQPTTKTTELAAAISGQKEINKPTVLKATASVDNYAPTFSERTPTLPADEQLVSEGTNPIPQSTNVPSTHVIKTVPVVPPSTPTQKLQAKYGLPVTREFVLCQKMPMQL